MEPTDGLQFYRAHKEVQAGEITEVEPDGCYVRNADGAAILRIFPESMTARYVPVPGDFWIVYRDGYQSISPRAEFLAGYTRLD